MPSVLPLLSILITVSFLVKNLQRMLRETHHVTLHQGVFAVHLGLGNSGTYAPFFAFKQKTGIGHRSKKLNSLGS